MRTLAALLVTLLVAPAAPAQAAPPRIVLEPGSSPPGQLVTVRGSGFCAASGCSKVEVQIAGVPVGADVSVSASGTFTVRGEVPGGRTGEVGVTAVQRLVDGSELTAFALLDVIARLQPTTKPKPKETAPTETSPAESGPAPREPDKNEPSTTEPAGTTTERETATEPTTPTTTEPAPTTTEPAPTTTEPAPTTPSSATNETPTDEDGLEAAAEAADSGGRTWQWLAPLGALLLGAAGLVGLARLRRSRQSR